MPKPLIHRIRTRRLPIWLAAFVVAATLAPAQNAMAQRGNESMFVSVLDAAGTPVSGLSVTDFVVEEDGAEREVLDVRPAVTPMQIAILVDTSASVADATGDLRRGLETLVEQLAVGNELALLSFGGTPRILVESTTRADRLQDGIGRVFATPNEAAYLLDALVETARGFERRETARPVIIVITGEGLDYSNRDAKQALDALKDSGTAAHMVVLRTNQNRAFNADPTEFGSDGGRERDQLLEMGPRASGGQRRDLLLSSRLDTTLAELAAALVTQYEVVYSRPASLIPPDAITVRMRRDDLSARGTPVRRTGD
jgi:hypothetical protein